MTENMSRSNREPQKHESIQTHITHITSKTAKVKNKDRILKATREKRRVIYKEIQIRLLASVFVETAGQKRVT